MSEMTDENCKTKKNIKNILKKAYLFTKILHIKYASKNTKKSGGKNGIKN